MSVKLKIAFAESTLWWKRFIKATLGRVISFVACFWLVPMPYASVGSQAGNHLFNLPGATHLRSGGWLDPGLSSLPAIPGLTGGRLNAAATNPARSCLCCSAEPPADDSAFSSKKLELPPVNALKSVEKLP